MFLNLIKNASNAKTALVLGLGFGFISFDFYFLGKAVDFYVRAIHPHRLVAHMNICTMHDHIYIMYGWVGRGFGFGLWGE